MNCQVILQVGGEDTSNNGGAQVEQDYQTGIATPRRDALSSLPGLRDGLPTGVTSTSDPLNPGYTLRLFQSHNKTDEGTDAIPKNAGSNDTERTDFYISGRAAGSKVGMEYGMHENIFLYQRCLNTERNRGLFLADQLVCLQHFLSYRPTLLSITCMVHMYRSMAPAH